jgi:glycosyltransferase involved in cell wall biosynthesis
LTTSPVRPLFLSESFHPVLGGGEGHIRELGARLAASGFVPSVLTRRGSAEWPASEQLDGIRVVRVGPPGPGRAGKYRMVPAVVRALRDELPAHDLLVVRGTRVLGIPGLWGARSAHKPVVLQPEVNGEFSGAIHTWGTPLQGGALERVFQVAFGLVRRRFRRADACVAMSRAIRDEMHAAGVPEARVHLIPHGVDLQRFRPSALEEKAELRRRLGLPEGVPLVAWTGRLLRGKGLEDLLEAFAATLRPAELVLVGSGEGQALSVESSLRERAGRGDLEGRVRFVGRVDRVEDYLRAVDAFVFPSHFEALGLSLIEAAACGLPAIGTRTGGIPDVIDEGSSGLLVPPSQPRELCDALRRVLDDPGERRRLGAGARRVAQQRFDREASLGRYRELFEGLTRSRR